MNVEGKARISREGRPMHLVAANKVRSAFNFREDVDFLVFIYFIFLA